MENTQNNPWHVVNSVYVLDTIIRGFFQSNILTLKMRKLKSKEREMTGPRSQKG